ncbi:hypothetical protein ACFRI7_25530 [Streptomyces sp. NPDC056716]|uniref:hypothetical protein n=1 Tax=unclassified Streptomyces TaxID=2593676 RepID=UPI0036BA5C14
MPARGNQLGTGATTTEATRRAVADAVYLGAACAATLAMLIVLTLAPRRFPVLPENAPPMEGASSD